jgi:hypothetical protein
MRKTKATDWWRNQPEWKPSLSDSKTTIHLYQDSVCPWQHLFLHQCVTSARAKALSYLLRTPQYQEVLVHWMVSSEFPRAKRRWVKTTFIYSQF